MKKIDISDTRTCFKKFPDFWCPKKNPNNIVFVLVY